MIGKSDRKGSRSHKVGMELSHRVIAGFATLMVVGAAAPASATWGQEGVVAKARPPPGAGSPRNC